MSKKLKPCPMQFNEFWCMITGDPCDIMWPSMCNAFQKAYEMGQRSASANEVKGLPKQEK